MQLSVRSATAYTSVLMIVRIFCINLEEEEEKKKGKSRLNLNLML